MTQKLKWGGVPDLPPPKNPFRDTLFVYGALSLIVVVVAWLTGGSIGRAIVIAVFFFVVASGWTIWRFRTRARAEAARKDER
jgi:nicotinamide riboside transporter PnuC